MDCNILGKSNSPSFFRSKYISLSLPLEKYILSKEHAFLSLFSRIGTVKVFPDFFIIMLCPASSSLISSNAVLKTV